MLDELLIKANESFKKFILGYNNEAKSEGLRLDFKNALIKASTAASTSKMSLNSIRDSENAIIASSNASKSPNDIIVELEAEQSFLISEKKALETFNNAKEDMDAFKAKYEGINENEKVALLPLFMELDDVYMTSKFNIDSFIILTVRDNEYLDRMINLKRGQLSLAYGALNANQPKVDFGMMINKEGGVVTKYIEMQSYQPAKVTEVADLSQPEQNTEIEPVLVQSSNPIPVEVEKIAPTFEQPSVQAQVEFFPKSYAPMDLTGIEQRIIVLSNKIDSLPSNKLKLGNSEAELLIEKIRLQSQLEIAKIRNEFEQVRAVFNSQLYELAADIQELRDKLKASKDDVEDIKFNAESTRKARNAAQEYAKSAAVICKKLNNIVKYLSNNTNLMK